MKRTKKKEASVVTVTDPKVAVPIGVVKDMELVHRQLHLVAHLCDRMKALAGLYLQVLPRALLDEKIGSGVIEVAGEWANSTTIQMVGLMMEAADGPALDSKRMETAQEANARWRHVPCCQPKAGKGGAK